MNLSVSAPLDPIQMLWVRGELSRFELLCVRSFLAHGHPVHLYSYDPPRNAPPGAQLLDAAAIVPASMVPTANTSPFGAGSLGAFSDYFRYHLLLARGGWWADMDVVCVRPWRFAPPALTASTHEFGIGRIANTFVIRFPAGHPIMAACAASLRTIELAEVGIDRTGPLLLWRTMQEQKAEHLMVAPEIFAPVPWNGSRQLVLAGWQRFAWSELKERLRRPHLRPHFTRETAGIHLWHETWRHAGRDKHATYPRSCLYERLQRRYNPATP